MTAKPSPTEEPIGAETELEARLIAHIHERLYIVIPGPEAELLDSGLIDSLAFVDLLLLIREEFGVEVDVVDLDMEDFHTVRRISQFILERRQADRADLR